MINRSHQSLSDPKAIAVQSVPTLPHQNSARHIGTGGAILVSGALRATETASAVTRFVQFVQGEVIEVLTISRLTRWSISYYNDTANKAMAATMDRRRERRAGGVLLRGRYSRPDLDTRRGYRPGRRAGRAGRCRRRRRVRRHRDRGDLAQRRSRPQRCRGAGIQQGQRAWLRFDVRRPQKCVTAASLD